MRSLAVLACAALIVGCGGSGGTAAVEDAAAERARQIAQLIAKADAAESLARSLAVDQPCATVEQCSAVTFESPLRGSCARPNFFAIYSTESATASATEAAAREQNALAKEAVALQPQPQASCPAVIFGYSLACVANRCVDASPR
jgi:hypothetical protein